MANFKNTIKSDIDRVFLDAYEFADTHNLNGTVTTAIVQQVVINDDLTTSSGDDAKYTDGLYGQGAVINVKKSNMPHVPHTGDVFRLNGKYGHVVLCNDDEGLLTITWAANES